MHEVLVNRLGGLSLPRKSVVRLTDRPDMTLDVYRGRKTTKQQQQHRTLMASLPRQFRLRSRVPKNPIAADIIVFGIISGGVLFLLCTQYNRLDKAILMRTHNIPSY